MRLFPLLFLALACTPDEEEKDSGGTLGVDTGDPSCEGTPPDIVSFTVSEGDPVQDENGNTFPSLHLTVEFEDDDGDAHVVAASLWWDSTVDGAIDSAAEPDAALPETALTSGGEPVEECAGEGGTLTIAKGVSGTDLAYSTQYDFGVTITDAHGLESEMAVATGTTPAEL